MYNYKTLYDRVAKHIDGTEFFMSESLGFISFYMEDGWIVRLHRDSFNPDGIIEEIEREKLITSTTIIQDLENLKTLLIPCLYRSVKIRNIIDYL
jgi:hypothetical protein